MKPDDLPKFYRAAFVYLPHVGTFRGGRGAWRVYACASSDDCDSGPLVPPRGIYVGYADNVKVLCMEVPRFLRRNTFVNPTTLLRILLEQRRAAALLATAARVWEGPRHGMA